MRIGREILLLSLLGLACGKVSRDGPAGEAPAAGSDDGGAQAVPEGSAGSAGSAGSNDGGTGGAETLSQVELTGTPIYTRVQRLTNTQWENAVTDILRFPQRQGFSAAFTPPISDRSPFDNNEQVLFVDQSRFSDFELGAEAAAAFATGSAEAITALYPGDDAPGFVHALGQRAFRRPLTATEETKYQNVFARGEELYGAGFAGGATLVIRALLESPYFLYRTELGPAGGPLSPYELASKLSFWLLGTTPSDSLLAAAAAGKFASTSELVAAAREMLEDPRALPVMRDFHDQLLHVSAFATLSKSGVPEFDSSVNPELAGVSNAFFDFIFTQNLGLRELLTSTKAYVSPALAPYYGVNAPAGLELRDVGPARSGYFMQVPFLMLDSETSESNPILRGSRLEAAMLCAPQRNPGDNPLGFALEGFDGLGRTRQLDNGLPIDTSGSYPFAEGVKPFADGNALMKVLADSEQAQTCYSKQVTSYALGRDLVESDRPLLESLAKVSGAQSLKELVVALVQDPAFRARKDGMP